MVERVGSAVVVGGGVVGLCCAWQLSRRGVAVTVLERDRLGAGASWGNAGQIEPAIAVPLPEPSAVRAGVRSLVDPTSVVRVPRRIDADLARFLAVFVRHSTRSRWRSGVRAFAPLNARAIGAYDELVAGGVEVPMTTGAFTAVCADAAESHHLLGELTAMAEAGLTVDVDILTSAQLRAAEPLAAARAGIGVRINDQRFVDPPALLAALGTAVTDQGGTITEHDAVRAIREGAAGVEVDCGTRTLRADAVVIATGAWLSRLATDHGVRLPVRAGRGYSMSVGVSRPPAGMLYFPGPRLACTPYRGRLRVSSLMDLTPPDTPPDEDARARFERTVARMLPDADVTAPADRWVGSRPLSADGLPVIGATRTPGVFVAGGHGMWGVTLGPVTGSLLAEQIVSGRVNPALRALDPTR